LLFFKRVDADPRHAVNLQIVFRQNDAAIDQPIATSSAKRLYVIRKRRVAPVIVIPWCSIDRRVDLTNKTERFGQVLLLFDQVTGETNELRLQLINSFDDFRRVIGVAAIMQIAELNEPAPGIVTRLKLPNPQPPRFV